MKKTLTFQNTKTKCLCFYEDEIIDECQMDLEKKITQAHIVYARFLTTFPNDIIIVEVIGKNTYPAETIETMGKVLYGIDQVLYPYNIK